MGLLSCLIAVGVASVGDTTLIPSDNFSPGLYELSEIEELVDGMDVESDETDPVDELLWLRENKYDLNTITREELESLPGMTSGQADAVLRLRAQVKRFTSVAQLKVLSDGEEIHQRMHNYVLVKRERRSVPKRKGSFMQVRSRALRDLQPRRGYLDNSYAGSSLKSYTRITTAPADDVQAGLLFEKDAGERTNDGFISGYVQVRNALGIGDVVAGDYSIEAGQGLVFWRGSAFGKGSGPTSVAKKSGLGVRPHRSADEFYFLRGVAASSAYDAAVGRVEAAGMYSHRALSATLESEEAIATLYDAGLFRTRGERERKNAVNEQLYGMRARFVMDEASLGVSYFHARLDKPRVSSRTYEFTGAVSSVGGVDATWRVDGVQFFGEVARSSPNGYAGIGGLTARVGSNTDVALLYRDYGAEFHNRYARGFGESSNTRNERGFYFGARTRLSSWLRLSGYLDHFKYPWRTFSVPLPVAGHDALVQAEVKPVKQLHVVARYSHKKTGATGITLDDLSRNIRPVIQRSQHKGRLTASYQASPELRVRGRIEGTSVRYPLLSSHERGFLFFQDIQYRVQNTFAIETRLVFFDTESFDSRIYEYENDIGGVFSNPALFGKGRRWYVIVRYRPADVITLSMKYAETQKEGVKSLGSGTSEIAGDIDNRLSMQVDIRF